MCVCVCVCEQFGVNLSVWVNASDFCHPQSFIEEFNDWGLEEMILRGVWDILCILSKQSGC